MKVNLDFYYTCAFFYDLDFDVLIASIFALYSAYRQPAILVRPALDITVIISRALSVNSGIVRALEWFLKVLENRSLDKSVGWRFYTKRNSRPA